MENIIPLKNETLKEFIDRNKDKLPIEKLNKIFYESLKKTKKTTELILK